MEKGLPMSPAMTLKTITPIALQRQPNTYQAVNKIYNLKIIGT